MPSVMERLLELNVNSLESLSSGGPCILDTLARNRPCIPERQRLTNCHSEEGGPNCQGGVGEHRGSSRRERRNKEGTGGKGILGCVRSNTDSEGGSSDEEKILRKETKGDRCYIPWSSPSLARRVVENVRSSPQLVRKVFQRRKVDIPGDRTQAAMHGLTLHDEEEEEDDDEVFSLSQNMDLIHHSGHETNLYLCQSRNAWTSMGEDVRIWADCKVATLGEDDDTVEEEDDDDDDEEESSCDEREDSWNYLKETNSDSE